MFTNKNNFLNSCKYYFASFVLIGALAANATVRADDNSSADNKFFGNDAREHVVEFDAVFRTEFTDLGMISAMNTSSRDQYYRAHVRPSFDYLFGPLTYRVIGSPQRVYEAQVNWNAAQIGASGKVEVPYHYKGTWILKKEYQEAATVQIPVPYDYEQLLTPNWKECTDSDPEHQTTSFYWYFWDPSRSGCEHVEGKEYMTTTVTVGAETPNTTETYPQYRDMLKSNGIDNNFQMTFAFGYVNEKDNPNPETDYDPGMYAYRAFVKTVRAAVGSSFTETVVYQREYLNPNYPDLAIGKRFQGTRNGVNVTINIVTSAGIDQMDLFAESFAHKHDGFFAWMGHSRVGSGFDARKFGYLLAQNPDYYSVTPNYQLVYWGGCNSYSYYTLPFFQFKADASGGADPKGTKGLDIIANGLPSYFSLNSLNATTAFRALFDWENPTSYQTIIRRIESDAHNAGIYVLAAILGDEDNN